MKFFSKKKKKEEMIPTPVEPTPTMSTSENEDIKEEVKAEVKGEGAEEKKELYSPEVVASMTQWEVNRELLLLNYAQLSELSHLRQLFEKAEQEESEE